MWLRHDNLKSCIEESWGNDFTRPLISQIAKKHIFVKYKLRGWNRNVFEHLFHRKSELKQKLLEIETVFNEGYLSEELRGKEKQLLS